MAERLAMICPTAKAEYFCAQGWTVDSGLIGLGKNDFWRNHFSVMPAAHRALSAVIPGRCAASNPESIPPAVQAARWIPGSR
jgi:hypothetical protein